VSKKKQLRKQDKRSEPGPERPAPGYLWPSAIALAVMIFYWAPLTSPSASIQWDAVDVHYSSQKYFADHVMSGSLPFWTPYLFSGFPFLADLQVGAFYPLNWPFFLIGVTPRMIELELRIDGDFVCRYRADGLIVASPTGSTAYSLSAGGPIVHPGVESFIITPICAHMLSDRPLVVRDSSCVEMKLSGNTESVFLTLDGQRGIPLQATDLVRISRNKELLKLIQPPRKSYFEILRNKLKWGEA
jgi:hypothetical protein